MGRLTGTHHGDAANRLLAFYEDRAHELEDAGEFFMAAVALALALETALLTYLLVEFGPENGGELEIPDSVAMSDLIEAANEIDVLNAPTDLPSHGRHDGNAPKHVARDATKKIHEFRRLIHPARALREGYDPRSFSHEDLKRFFEMYGSVTHSLLSYL